MDKNTGQLGIFFAGNRPKLVGKLDVTLKPMNTDNPLQIDSTAMILLIGNIGREQQNIAAMLEKAGHQCGFASSARQALEVLGSDLAPDILITLNSNRLVDDLRTISESVGDNFPIIVIGDGSNDQGLAACQMAGVTAFVGRPVDPSLLLMSVHSALRLRQLHQQQTTLRQQLSSHQQQLELEREVAAIIYKNVLQRNYLQTEVIKAEMPAMALFNGDLLLVERTPDNHLHVLLGDFTCHGLAASVVASPVASIFYGMSRKGFAITDIVREINGKLHSLLPINQFLAATVVALYPESKSLGVIGCGLPDQVLVNDLDGSYQFIESKNRPLGVYGAIEPEERNFTVNEHHHLYLMTDAVLRMENVEGEVFGVQRVMAAVCKQAGSGLEALKASLIEHGRGLAQSNDDVALVELICDVNNVPWQHSSTEQATHQIQALSWKTIMELDIHALRRLNPVPVMVNALMEIQGLQEHRQSIFLIASELFANALDHGVLGLDSSIKSTPEGFMRFYELKEERIQRLQQGSIRLLFSHRPTEQGGRLTIKLIDSGNGFDWQAKRQNLAENVGFSGRGLKLLETLCTQLTYHGKGNRVTAVFDWQS